jgi:pimeloyl-ACP methyl ester carboxylesterase
MPSRPGPRPRLLALACAFLALLLAAPLAQASVRQRSGGLAFKPCGTTADAATTECATADLPLDYDHPRGRKVHIAVARVPAADQAHRIGSLFFNFGGPGGPAVDYLQAVGATGYWAALNERFDIVGFDPRGVGQSTPSVDCNVDQERQGIYSQPFYTPLTLDLAALLRKDKSYIRRCLKRNGRRILSHLSTANVARDMDQLRGLLGEPKLNYFGYSYGTFLGATFARLFPNRYRSMVLDGPVDASGYINKPSQNLSEQSAGFERAFRRFFQACARDQVACSGFGGDDPSAAWDELVESADTTAIPADGYTPDPRPVDGDDLRWVATGEVYLKELWGELGLALKMAQQGDGSLVRALADLDYERNDDGSYGPGYDTYFTIGAAEQRFRRDLGFYLERGDESWGEFDNTYFNAGYVEINYALWPVRDKDAYAGPFRVRGSRPTPLVIATTYDPATPYRGALRLVRELGNARLITMRGDGHTAYPGEAACIDQAAEAYVNELVLPPKGTVCRQEVQFEAPQLTARARARRAGLAVRQRRITAMRVPRP